MLCWVCQTMQKHMVALILSCSLEIICEIIICNSKEFIIKARTAWDIAHELHEIKNKSWLRTVAVGNNLMEGKALPWVSGEGRAWPGAEGGGVLGLRRDHGRGQGRGVEKVRCSAAGPVARVALISRGLCFSLGPLFPSDPQEALVPDLHRARPQPRTPAFPFTLFSLLYLGLSPSFDCFHR